MFSNFDCKFNLFDTCVGSLALLAPPSASLLMPPPPIEPCPFLDASCRVDALYRAYRVPAADSKSLDTAPPPEAPTAIDEEGAIGEERIEEEREDSFDSPRTRSLSGNAGAPRRQGDGIAKPTDAGSQGNKQSPSSRGESATAPRPSKPSDATQNPRDSRMLTYVNRAGEGDRDGKERPLSQAEIDAIDTAAIKAVLDHEDKRGWQAEEQPHDNPGYDIISTSPDGEQRFIEVKGLRADWTKRGVKLSRTQYDMAREQGSKYWLYVVENATDSKRREVHAIGNPFEQVGEYWFDNNWRLCA